MKNEYIDRSLAVYEEWKDKGMGIDFLKRQTRYAIEEATAKNLISQAKLQQALENEEQGSIEYKKIDRTLAKLQTNWGELNYLYNEVSWREPLPWDEDYEAMENLIALVQKVRGL